jgi:hypothetical protein
MIEVEIKNADEVIRYLTQATPRELREALGEAFRDALIYIHAHIPPYPPPRPGQKYRRGLDPRSERLGQSYTTRVEQKKEGTEFTTHGYLGTAVSYAPWVVSKTKVATGGPQAWMHQGRWYTLQDVVEKAAPNLAQVILKTLKSKIGGG